MKHNKQNGFVIELMIVFMLITFGFCAAITIYVGSLNNERKVANLEIVQQTVLNQFGEYYIRAIEAGGAFPSGSEVSYSGFSRMDDNGDGVCDIRDETVKFFEDNKHYTFADKMSTEYGDFRSFYSKLSVKRRLVISQNEETKLVIIVEEKYTDNNASEYTVLNWSVGGDIDLGDDGDYTQDVSLNVLQKLWRFFGLVKKDFSGIRLSDLSDLMGFFNNIDSNWRSAFS